MNINFKNISKRYEGNIQYTLEDINLDIKSGEFVAFLGPSGCGKTTLLRMIAGLNSITTGDLLFDGKRVNTIDPKNRDIAMVFQSYALYPHLSVFNNIAYSLKIRKVSKYKIDQKVKSVSKILKIDHILYKTPGEISGGQRQRVALGRAIIRKPKIFLMDEPLSNLDAKLRESMRTELVAIHKLLETTTIYVTHDQLEAMTMADKIVLFNNSKIQQIGTPINLYEDPVNLFVANFIGTTSATSFEVTWDKKNSILIIDDTKFNISSQKVKKILGDQKKAIVCFRANMISLSNSHKNTLQASYFTMENLGDRSYDKVFLDQDKTIIMNSNNMSKNNKYGDKVYIEFDFEKAFYFDCKTEKRIK